MVVLVMALNDNPFIGLPLADVQTLQAQYIQVVKDLATTGQSYTFPGRSLTRADLQKAKDTLGELNQAIDFFNGKARQVAQARINTQGRYSG